MPVLRQLAKDNMDLSLTEAVNLLKSEFHEARMTALLILVLKFQQEDEITQAQIVKLYLKYSAYMNGWDLVDCYAHLMRLAGCYARWGIVIETRKRIF